MRKLFAFAGLMMAAIVSLTNCQRNELEPRNAADGIKLVLSLDDTKTTNDGMSTLWAEKDKVGVFYRDVTGGFASLGAFNLTSGAGTKSATFEPASTDTEGFKNLNQSEAYDWYVLYPYNSNVSTPASVDADGGFMYVGRKTGLNQAGYDSSAAISGDNCPMYLALQGATINDLSGNVAVKHLTSLVEFTLVNNTGKDIVIGALTMTASEPIVGDFFIDVTGNGPAYTPRDTEHALKAATVNIQDAGTLAPGASAKVYLPIKPYYQSGKEPFMVSVTGTFDGKAASKEFSSVLEQDKSYFDAGKVKKITLKIDAMTLTEGCTVAEVLAGEVGAEYSLNGVQVTSVVGNSYFVSDATGTIMCYKSSHGLATGDIVNVSGKTKAYNNLVEFDGPAATKVSDGTRSVTPEVWSDTQMAAAYGNAQIAFVTYQALFTAARNATIPGSEAILYTTNASGVSITKNKTYKVTGYVYGWTDYEKSGSVTKEVCMYVESAEEVGAEQTASLEISPKSMTFEAAGGSKELTVTCDNEKWSWGDAPLWVSVARDGNKVTIGVAENTAEDKRECEIVFTHPAGELTATLKITQKGTVEEDKLSLSVASLGFSSAGNEAKEVTISCNDHLWYYDTQDIPEWLFVMPDKENDKLTISCAPNYGDARSYVLAVHHANAEITRNLSISQNAASASGAKTYSIVTSTSQLTSGEYIIVFTSDSGDSFAMNGGLSTLDAASNGVSVTVSGTSINYSGDDVYFTYNADEGSLLGAGGKYLAHSGSSNKINSVSSYAEATCKLTITFDGENAVITAPSSYIIRYNVADGQNRFRFYKATSTDKNLYPVKLYKKN